MRIGFRIGGDDVCHVSNVLPIAEQLLHIRPSWSVFVATEARRTADAVERFREPHAPNPVHLRLRARGLIHPAADPKALLSEADVLPSFDAVIDAAPLPKAMEPAAHQTHILLHLDVGDHDRPAITRPYDLVLVAGEKARARMIDAGGIAPDRIAVTGSPILDLPVVPIRLWPDDGRKAVVYNPHGSPGLSSWFRWGRAILDWFVDHPEYRLILAPHPGLFARRLTWPEKTWWPRRTWRPEERHLRAANIHIDLANGELLSRAYLESADIYLGDASGQLYEFLARPRPCGFLSAQTISEPFDSRFIGWSAGHVVDDVRQLGELLQIAVEWHEQVYRPVQEQLFRSSISVTAVPAALRAAEAIVDCVERGYAIELEPCRA